MSSNNKSSAAPIILTVVAGVAIGVTAIAAWAFKKLREPRVEEENQRIFSSPYVEPRRSVSTSSDSSRSEPPPIWECEICKKNEPNNIQALPCGHKFHRKCLEANVILHKVKSSREDYRCPILMCRLPVPSSITNTLHP